MTLLTGNVKIIAMELKNKNSDLFGFLAFFFSIAFLFGCCCFNFFIARAQSTSDIQENISDIQKKINQEEAEKKALEKELNQIQTSVNITQVEIKKTQGFINETSATIGRHEEEINLLEKKVNLEKAILAGLLRETYYSQNSLVLTLALEVENPSQFLGSNDHLESLEEKIVDLIDEMKNTRLNIEKNKVKLEESKEEHEQLLALKQDQQQDLLGEKVETQGDIREKEATIAELQAKLAKLRSNLSSFLGKAYNAKDISDAASFAAKATGVRKDFIMGMLVVESDLGRFTGGCTATESKMSSYRLGIFKDICSELDYNWKKQKVSCPPKGYKGTGGAMGVAQFMPDTWTGYKSSIASNTGHNPPDPWNLTDGVTAMGLKLARGGATKKSGECNAAKLYLSGTTSSKYNWYCQKVLYWADNYERLLD